MTPHESLAARLAEGYPLLCSRAQARCFADIALRWMEERLPGREEIAEALFTSRERALIAEEDGVVSVASWDKWKSGRDGAINRAMADALLTLLRDRLAAEGSRGA